MQSDMDGMKLEISRKDANISMLGNEKHRLSGELTATEGKNLLCLGLIYRFCKT